MQQFKSLFYKEFGTYFQSTFVYCILFIYLLISIGAAFTFGAYLTIRDSSVYALFYLQPVVLTMLLPALTMRLWSEEYKSGTAEFLLTQPLNYALPTLAKFCAAVALSCLMPFFLLPFVFYTSTWLQLDWSSIACGYCGLWLLTTLFCALGALISSFNKHIIASYILSVFIMTLWLFLPQTGLYEVYTDFLLAEISFADIAYILLFGGALLLLNIMVPAFRASAQKHKTFRFIGFSALLLFGVILLNYAVGSIFTHRLDLSAHKIYSLQPATVELISKIQEPIYIDVYIAKDFRSHNVEYFRHYQQVQRFLKKYQTASGGLIHVSITEVEPFSQLENAVLEYGLYYEINPDETKDYFGAVIHNDRNTGIIIKKFAVERTPYLEKDIDTALLKLSNPTELSKSIGIYLDPTQNLERYNGFMLNLEEDYDVTPVTDDVYEISPQLDLLILLNPKQFSAVFRYALDQYILNGGKVIALFDLLSKNQSDAVNLQPLGMIDFFDKWGILIADKLTDSGSPDIAYYQGDLPLNIYRALEFTSVNKNLLLKPIINGSKEKYVGAIIEGILPSLYEQNPLQDATIKNSMLPHSLFSTGSAKVALIGDTDLADDEFWLDTRSEDANPYTAVYKSANMEILRNLIDDMLDISVYKQLPIRSKYTNTYGIGQKIYNHLYSQIEPLYVKLNEQINELKTTYYQSASNHDNPLLAQQNVNKLAQQIAELEKQSDAILYHFKAQYSVIVHRIMLTFILLWPLLAVLLLWLMLKFMHIRKTQKIKGLFNE